MNGTGQDRVAIAAGLLSAVGFLGMVARIYATVMP
jgi:hypothetical protein